MPTNTACVVDTPPTSPPASPPSDPEKPFVIAMPDDRRIVGDYSDEGVVEDLTPTPFTAVTVRKSKEPWEPPHVRTLEKCQEGYPMLAAFLSSDRNFSVYRSFAYLHARWLLYQQDEIGTLERQLDEMDHSDAKNQSAGIQKSLRSRARDDARKTKPRVTLLKEIKEKLLEYDEVLLKAKELASFQQPSARDYRSVRRWLNNWKPLVDEEQAYVLQKEDLITLRSGRECAGFDGFIESMLHKMDCRLIKWLFTTPETRAKSDDNDVRYFAQSRVDILVNIIITFVIVALLVLPVVALYRLSSFKTNQSSLACLGVLMVFTLVFSLIISILTKARRCEVFAASAA